MKVLILETEEKQLDVIRTGLNGQDYDVIQLDSGSGAIDNFKEMGPGIIIADFDKPGFSGLDLINNLLAADLDEYPYVIFLVKKDAEKYVIDALGPIPGDFLVRPINIEEFKARLAIAERSLALQSRLRSSAGHSESLALYDNLTSVLNRQAVYERALAEINRSQREGVQVGLAMIEITNLVDIHESYGPKVRDQAIRFVARASRANVRIYDVVGRWIGAKFMLLLPGISPDNARLIFERIHRAITTIRVRVPSGERLDLEVAVGFTHVTKDDSYPLYIMIEEANKALSEVAVSSSEHVLLFDRT